MELCSKPKLYLLVLQEGGNNNKRYRDPADASVHMYIVYTISIIIFSTINYLFNQISII